MLTCDNILRAQFLEFIFDLLDQSGDVCFFRFTFLGESLMIDRTNVMERILLQKYFVGSTPSWMIRECQCTERTAVI